MRRPAGLITSVDRRILASVFYLYGRRLLVKFPLVSFFSAPLTAQADILLISKRWIVDRATLKQARAEDMRYVKDPLFFDLFNIFTGNRTASPAPLRILWNAESNPDPK